MFVQGNNRLFCERLTLPLLSCFLVTAQVVQVCVAIAERVSVDLSFDLHW